MSHEQSADFVIKCDVAKVDEALGLVCGYAIVCNEGGEPYFDTQGDHVPEESMLEAAYDFMKFSREVRDGHGDAADIGGMVVFAYPMTEDIAKALDIQVKQTGLLIGMKPSEELLSKFVSGEYTGFSIGGRRVTDEILAE